jgi:Glycosyl transferase family 2
MKLAPIALFTYNRLIHTRRTLEALQKNEWANESELYIFSDGPKTEKEVNTIKETRNYLHTIDGFKSVTIIERETNLGLAANIISGVNQILDRYDNIIVLEDDLITSPYFLRYLNDGLALYENEKEVISIHGYLYPVRGPLPETFFIKIADCYGWATWKRGWDLFEPDGNKLLHSLIESKQEFAFDFQDTYPFTQMLKDQTEGKNNSWAIRWYASAFLKNKLTLFPGKSLVNHIGSDGSGTHSGFSDVLDTSISERRIEVSKIKIVQDEQAYKAFVRFFPKVSRPKLMLRIRRKMKTISQHYFQSNK